MILVRASVTIVHIGKFFKIYQNIFRSSYIFKIRIANKSIVRKHGSNSNEPSAPGEAYMIDQAPEDMAVDRDRVLKSRAG